MLRCQPKIYGQISKGFILVSLPIKIEIRSNRLKTRTIERRVLLLFKHSVLAANEMKTVKIIKTESS